MLQLGGIKLTGVGWRVSEKRLVEYVRKLERGLPCETPSSRSSRAVRTGTVTSEPRTASDSNAPYTSETTEPKPAVEPPSPPTGKSKHALRLAQVIAKIERESRSAKRSTRSERNKNLPA
jgi:hypothetical protein